MFEFAEAKMMSLFGKPIISSISCDTRSGCALGKSILFTTGTISRSCSSAT